METLFYVVLVAVLVGIIVDGTDRHLERLMRSRREPGGDIRLVGDFDAKPAIRPRRPRTSPKQSSAPPTNHRRA